MRVLVSSGIDDATEGIGARIGAILRDRGHEVDQRSAAEVIDVEDYDVVVLGSAVDRGHWRDDARLLVLRTEGELAARPVWLFSSQPGPDTPTVVDVSDVMSATHAFEHRSFGTRTRASTTTAVATAVLVPEDDEGSWDDVDRWAVSIADSISSG
jgi:menaquinone-dependent protoporphyrinogen oxidase